ncbi:hypothetical protein B7463_g7436, partial [Scytalidium lignicola]
MTPRGPGSETLRRFIKKLQDPDCYDDDDLERLDDGEGYIIVSDPKLGVKLVHAGIHPEAVHYRHKIYMVIESHGKAANRVAPPGTVVASILTAQYTKRKALCKALLLSVQSKGKRVVADHPDSSSSRCSLCGHNAVFRSVCYNRNFWSGDDYDWKLCCSVDAWWSSYSTYTCCACKEGTMSGFNTENSSNMTDDTPKTMPLDEPQSTPLLPTGAFTCYPQVSWQTIQSASKDGEHGTKNYFFHQQNVYVGAKEGTNYSMVQNAQPTQRFLPDAQVEEVSEEINLAHGVSIEAIEQPTEVN